MSQSQLEFLNFKKDSFIVVEGDEKADRFFIIRQGSVRILKEMEIIEEDKDVLVAGDFFAVVSTMSSHSHIETVQALDDVSLISIKKENYGDIIQSNPGIAHKIIQKFSKKMRYLNEALTQLTLKSTANEDPSHLFDVAEYYFTQNRYNHAYYAYNKYLAYCPKGASVAIAHTHKDAIAPHVQEKDLQYKEQGAVRTYPKDALFFSESEPGEELFIIQKGSVKITKIVDNQEILLALLKPGDIFGEMAILENKPRSASATAHDGACVAMAVNKANFEAMAKTQPQIIARLTILLAERIWSLYRQLASTLIQDPVGRLYDALLLYLEKNRIATDADTDYTFGFGREDLITMVGGLSKEEGMAATRQMLEDSKKMQVREDKLYCPDLRIIPKEVQFYRRMDKKKANIEEFHQKNAKHS